MSAATTNPAAPAAEITKIRPAIRRVDAKYPATPPIVRRSYFEFTLNLPLGRPCCSIVIASDSELLP
jgi:hypothetical protein